MTKRAKSIGELLSRYGWQGTVRLAIDLLGTRLFFAGARIIRRPYYIRGSKNIELGRGFTAGVGMRLDAFFDGNEKILTIGENVEVNDYVHIAAVKSVKIGRNVLIASKVFISDHNHGDYAGNQQSSPEISPAAREIVAAPVVIEDNVWIGEGVAILPGVTIGRGAIIGANSVVTGNVEPACIYAGAPAKKIKFFDAAAGKWIKFNGTGKKS